MSDREKRIREQRKLEADNKKYLGKKSKFVMIATIFGDKIISDVGDGEGFEYRDLPDFYGDPSPSNGIEWDTGKVHDMPEGARPSSDDMDWGHFSGLIYDGLKIGLNLQIIYMIAAEEVTVRYNGDVVYSERLGNLRAFAPDEEWEDHINRLATKAMEIYRKNGPQFNAQKIAEIKQEKALELSWLRKKWGKFIKGG